MAVSRDRLRNAALFQRRNLAQSDRFAWNQAIQARAITLSHYCSARYVALYSPVQNEVDNRAILIHGLASGKKIFYPKSSRPGAPAFAAIDSAVDFVAGRFGIPEPVGSEPLTPAHYDSLIVFVPGVLFDRRGNRLGRGGGWYDRALSELGSRGIFVGLAYGFQVVESLPAESWDQSMHFIITEEHLFDCGHRPQSTVESSR